MINTSEYYIVNGGIYSSDELYHHGVKGMKWGVIRARKNHADRGITRRQAKNIKLERKAAKYDVKAGKRVDQSSLVVSLCQRMNNNYTSIKEGSSKWS